MHVNSAELEEALESNPQGLIGKEYVGKGAIPIHDNKSAIHAGEFVIFIDSDTREIEEVIER